MNAPPASKLPPAYAAVDRALTNADQEAADMRGAACLNLLDLCIRQSGRLVKSNADFKALRILLGTADHVVLIDNAETTVPAGFGPAVKVKQSATLDAVAAALAPPPEAQSAQDEAEAK